MNVELPKTRPYGALFAVGTRLSAGGTVETIGSVIVKAAFHLTASGGSDTHAMSTDTNPAASALVMTDQRNGNDVTREADIAPYKPLADIAVEGFLGGLDKQDVEVRVNGTLWLTRIQDINHDGVVDAADVAGLPTSGVHDRNLHLFGYHPRAERLRQNDATIADPTNPANWPKSLDEFDYYDNSFLNFHRRSNGFTASGNIASQLGNGQRIAVRKAGSDALTVTLPLPRLSAMYRIWCGHGPDKAPYWTHTALGAMHADTLILRPDAANAEVVWRATWLWNAEPASSYRAIRVTEGGP